MRTSESIKNIAPAFHKAQSEMCNAKLNKRNPYHNSRYADLESITDAIKKPLNDNGLFFSQEAVTIDDSVSVITRVIHTSGEYFEYGPIIVPTGKKDAHSTGSSVTYSKRYQLSAIFGIVAEEDDDGNRAQKSHEVKPREASEKEIKDFMAKHAKSDEELELIEEFLDKYSTHYKKTKSNTVAMFIDQPKSFNSLLSKFKEKQRSKNE